jgi:hypothetical protein
VDSGRGLAAWHHKGNKTIAAKTKRITLYAKFDEAILQGGNNDGCNDDLMACLMTLNL